MTILLPFLNQLHALRAYVFSRRFMPFAIVCLIAMVGGAIGLTETIYGPGNKLITSLVTLTIAGALWISSTEMLPHEKRWLRQTNRLIDMCCYEDAEKKLASPPWLAGFAVRIRRLEMLARLKIETGDLAAAYAVLATAEQGALLQEERVFIRLAKTGVLFEAGNYVAFRKELGELASSVQQSKLHHFKYLLLKSEEHGLSGQYGPAKSLLEDAIEQTSEPRLLVSAYNNLARLEDMQGNHTNAQSYYEQAWHALQKEPLPRLYPVVIHNLLIKYAQYGQPEKAISLLEDYRAAVMPGNIHQALQLINDQLILARQLGDRHLLLDSYARTEGMLKPHLDKRQRFVVAVTELRMRLNDDIEFAKHLVQTLVLFDEHEDLSVPEQFTALSELLVVLNQCGEAQAEGLDLRGPRQRTIFALLAMQGDIDAQLRDAPTNLPLVRDIWLRHKIQLCKLKLQQPTGGISYLAAQELFRLQQERRRVWADKENFEFEIDALIVLCDEYVAYARHLDVRFANDYYAVAQQALTDAGNILESRWPHPSMHQYALGIAYFYWQIGNDKKSAAYWLSRFDGLNLNVAHYAKWLRGHYAEVKEWVGGLH